MSSEIIYTENERISFCQAVQVLENVEDNKSSYILERPENREDNSLWISVNAVDYDDGDDRVLVSIDSGCLISSFFVRRWRIRISSNKKYLFLGDATVLIQSEEKEE